LGGAVAVDWSGAADPAVQRRTIWVAVAVDGTLRSLTAGRTRDETVAHLLDLDAPVIGLDFSFGFPGWFSSSLGASAGPDVWELAAGAPWLERCEFPFWGRPGVRRPAFDSDQPEWRRTELLDGSPRPKSTFQIGGKGAVGTGSIRGMPCLSRLRAAGVSVWPFDPPGSGPVAAEVYPRWCTGRVVKSSPVARADWLSTAWPGLRRSERELAVASEDAFDAACAALTLSSAGVRFDAADAIDRLEGRILVPAALAGLTEI
jgi:predicted nuclease with RNAse H fold